MKNEWRGWKPETCEKLVSDGMPDVIRKRGAKPIICTADEENTEAMNAYMKHGKVSIDKAEKTRKFKLRERWGLEKRITPEGIG